MGAQAIFGSSSCAVPRGSDPTFFAIDSLLAPVMAPTLEEVEADICELKGMLETAKRPNVRQELERLLRKAEQELKAVTNSAAVASAASSAAKLAASSSAPTPAATPKPSPVQIKAAGPWVEITTFGLELGGYNSPHVVVDIRLKGVEALPAEAVTCDFTESSFDLKVIGLDGKNHRMIKTNLDKDIVPAESSVRVKKNHVLITMQKIKGEYGYDSWTDLCAKGKRKPANSQKSENPQDSIMGMMKDLYEDGDDNMKKIIGEAMYKAQKGEKYEPKDADLPKMSDSLDDL